MDTTPQLPGNSVILPCQLRRRTPTTADLGAAINVDSNAVVTDYAFYVNLFLALDIIEAHGRVLVVELPTRRDTVCLVEVERYAPDHVQFDSRSKL